MYQHILLAVDGSASSDLALREAARVTSAGATLRAVTVVENPLLTFPTVYGVADNMEMVASAPCWTAGARSWPRRKASCGARCNPASRSRRAAGSDAAGRHDPEAIEQQADSWPADLIVIGSHGRSGVKRLLLGSVAEHLLRLSTRPILLVRGPQVA